MNRSLAPNQVAALTAIEERVENIATGKGGSAIFLAGSNGSGRSHLLGEAAARLAEGRAGARVAFGSVGGASDSGLQSSSPRADVQLASKVIDGIGLIAPEVALLKRLATLSSAARDTYRSALGKEPEELPRLLVRALRAAAHESPLVCLIDDADHLDAGWWSTLQLALSDEFETLPLLIVLAVDGPPSLTSDLAENEPLTLRTARSLCERGSGVYLPLTPLSAADLRTWLGPAPDHVVQTALEITDGRAGDLAEYWNDWERRGVIVHEEERWSAPGGSEPFLPDAAASLGLRLSTALSHAPESLEEAPSLDLAQRVLAVAALEGQEFTAEVVASTIGLDRDMAIDLLDLLVDDDRPRQGILRELGFVEVVGHLRAADGEPSTSKLSRYRFSRSTEWRAARRWVKAENAQAIAHRAAVSMAQLYGQQRFRLASSLVRLARMAGDEEAARYYGQASEMLTSRAVLLPQARALVTKSSDGWADADLRDASLILQKACAAGDGVEDAATLLGFAQAATEFASRMEADDPDNRRKGISFARKIRPENREHRPRARAPGPGPTTCCSRRAARISKCAR